MSFATISDMSRFVTFRLADLLAGVNILDIREIVPAVRIAPVAQSPDFVTGLINLRGQILVVLDIVRLLGLKRREDTFPSHVIVFKHKDVGFIVDRIGDVISLDTAAKKNIPANIGPGIQKYVEEIIDFSGEMLMILNSGKILSESLSARESSKGEP